MTLALLYIAQHVSDVNTSIFRSQRVLVLCRLTRGVLMLCTGMSVGDVVSECRLNHYVTFIHHSCVGPYCGIFFF